MRDARSCRSVAHGRGYRITPAQIEQSPRSARLSGTSVGHGPAPAGRRPELRVRRAGNRTHTESRPSGQGRLGRGGAPAAGPATRPAARPWVAAQAPFGSGPSSPESPFRLRPPHSTARGPRKSSRCNAVSLNYRWRFCIAEGMQQSLTDAG